MAAAAHASTPPTPASAAQLVWLRPGSLRLADNEPLTAAAAAAGGGLLLPWLALDVARQLVPPPGSLLALPALGPHQLRLLLEATASLRASLRSAGSDLLWAPGPPEAVVGQLVALSAAAGASSIALHHAQQPGPRAAELEGTVAAAFRAAAEAYGAGQQPKGRAVAVAVVAAVGGSVSCVPACQPASLS